MPTTSSFSTSGSTSSTGCEGCCGGDCCCGSVRIVNGTSAILHLTGDHSDDICGSDLDETIEIPMTLECAGPCNPCGHWLWESGGADNIEAVVDCESSVLKLSLLQGTITDGKSGSPCSWAADLSGGDIALSGSSATGRWTNGIGGSTGGDFTITFSTEACS